MRAFMSEPWVDGSAANSHLAEPKKGAQPLYAMAAVDEANAILRTTEPEPDPAHWYAPLGVGSLIACGPWSEPTFVDLDAIVAESLGAFLSIEVR